MVKFKDIFVGAFVGTSGFLTAYMLIGLYSLTLFSIGFYLIMTYNKKNTKVFKDLHSYQYVGVVLCILSILPFAQYFFRGFLTGAGSFAFKQMIQ